MTLRAKLSLASCVLASLLLSACGGANTATTNAPASNAARPANAAAPAATAAAPAATAAAPSAGAGVTGVASCDEYIALYERCINNPSVPEAMKGAWRTALEQNRTAWRQAASTPAGKAQLESTCPQILAQSKPQLEQFCK